MTQEELEEKTVAWVRGYGLSLNSYCFVEEISSTIGEKYASGDDREVEDRGRLRE
jgi:hypothetical protein